MTVSREEFLLRNKRKVRADFLLKQDDEGEVTPSISEDISRVRAPFSALKLNEIVALINLDFNVFLQGFITTLQYHIKSLGNAQPKRAKDLDAFETVTNALEGLRKKLYPHPQGSNAISLEFKDIEEIKTEYNNLISSIPLGTTESQESHALMLYAFDIYKLVPSLIKTSQEAVNNCIGPDDSLVTSEEVKIQNEDKFRNQLQSMITNLETLSARYQQTLKSNPKSEQFAQKQPLPPLPNKQPKAINIALWIALGALVAALTVLTCGIAGAVAGGVFGGFLAVGSTVVPSALAAFLGPIITPMVTGFVGLIGSALAGISLSPILYGVYNGFKKLAGCFCRKEQPLKITVPTVIASDIPMNILERVPQGVYLMRTLGGENGRHALTTGAKSPDDIRLENYSLPDISLDPVVSLMDDSSNDTSLSLPVTEMKPR